MYYSALMHKFNPTVFCVFRKKVFNFPIDPRIPKMAQWGLWGGEGILEGLRMYKYNPENPRFVLFVVCAYFHCCRVSV